MKNLPAPSLHRSSSIDCLPRVALTEIFKLFLTSGGGARYPGNLSGVTANPYTSHTPLDLMHVCRAWRELAKSTSSIWSSIEIQQPGDRHIPLIRVWMESTGSYPLSIYFYDSLRYQDKPQQSVISAVLGLLINRSHLWKSVDFSFKDDQPDLLKIPVGSLNMLEHASVCLTNQETHPYLDNLWTIFHSSQRLSSVRWLTAFDPLSTAPWDQLTSVECRFPVPMNAFLRSLQSCRCLEELVWDNFPSGGDNDLIGNFTFPSLKELRLECLGDTFGKLIGAISTPKLIMLALLGINSDYVDFSAFKSFMTRSGCMLETFLFLAQ
ncbi:hypothetical protein BDQ17DRAFT_1424177 [Cyathus striatus]|nr:hypothetical protein BDQ17DRAFT_1424177 [Cyathus striatus]